MTRRGCSAGRVSQAGAETLLALSGQISTMASKAEAVDNILSPLFVKASRPCRRRAVSDSLGRSLREVCEQQGSRLHRSWVCEGPRAYSCLISANTPCHLRSQL